MQLARLWREHLEAGCPGELQGLEIAGSGVVALDAEVTACVSAIVTGRCDAGEHIVRRLEEIQKALENTPLHTEDPIAGYCERLNRLVSAALIQTRVGHES
jgi:hypothetical protein